ncbi:UNVERIFIED_ORG: hypothetical protein FHR35_009128 [Microbispora rosea subsp. rosea]
MLTENPPFGDHVMSVWAMAIAPMVARVNTTAKRIMFRGVGRTVVLREG